MDESDNDSVGDSFLRHLHYVCLAVTIREEPRKVCQGSQYYLPSLKEKWGVPVEIRQDLRGGNSGPKAQGQNFERNSE